MWREFGNPVFPLMNAWFRSPDAPAFNLLGARFGPPDALGWIAFPFRMGALDRDLYVEIFAPDTRFAALAAAAAALGVAVAAGRAAGGRALRAADGVPTGATRVMSVVPPRYWPPESISSRPSPSIVACESSVAR